MSNVQEVTDATFQSEVLQSTKPVLVDFWAPWCGPCRAVAPILDQLSVEHADKIRVVKLNTDDNPVTAGSYGIVSIPTLLVFKGGELIKSIVGAKPKPLLVAELGDVLA